MPYVEVCDDDESLVKIATNYVDRFLIKQLPGARYNGSEWRAPKTWATCVILRGLFKNELIVGQRLVEWSRHEYETRVAPAMELRLALEIPERYLDTPAAKVIMSWRGTRRKPDGAPLDLRPFQEAGVLFFYYGVSVGLGDPMGTGKTAQGINYLKLLHELGEDPFPALVVAPNTVTRVWAEELDLWAPELGYQIIKGSAVERRQQIAETSDVSIINWEALRLHSRLAGYGSYSLRGCRVCDKDLLKIHDDALQRLTDLKEKIKANGEQDEPDEALAAELAEQLPLVEKAYKDAKRGSEHSTCERCPRELNEIHWQVVLADEAHRALAPASKQTRALWAVSKHARHKPWMSGTIIDGNAGELWSPLHYMAPDEWPSKTRYLEYFTDKQFNVWGGMEILGFKDDTRETLFKIFEPRFRRLPKDVVLPELPPLNILPPRLVEMSPKQRRAYKQMLDHLMAEVEDGSLLLAPNPLVRTMRLLQFASSFASLSESGGVELSLPSNKVDFLEDEILGMSDEQVVVFTTAPDLVKLCSERLKSMKVEHGVIYGEIDPDVRYDQVRDFQAGNLRVIVANVQTGGEGISLTAAPVLIRLQRHWRNTFNLQAIDRIHRFGSDRHPYIRVIDAVTDGTVEVSQMAALAGKFGRFQEVVRDKETMMMILRGEVPTDELALAS